MAVLTGKASKAQLLAKIESLEGIIKDLHWQNAKHQTGENNLVVERNILRERLEQAEALLADRQKDLDFEHSERVKAEAALAGLVGAVRLRLEGIEPYDYPPYERCQNALKILSQAPPVAAERVRKLEALYAAISKAAEDLQPLPYSVVKAAMALAALDGPGKEQDATKAS